MLKLFNRILDRLEEWIISILIAGATAVTFIAVLHRYGASESVVVANVAERHGFAAVSDAANAVYGFLAGINLSWAQELATYMLVWMAKFGAALGVRTGIHVGVDVFVKHMPPRAAKPVVLFALFCGALFTGVIGTLGAVYVWELDPEEVSPELEWPSWIMYLCIPLGSYLMCYRFLQAAWQYHGSGHLAHSHGEYRGEPPVAEPAR